MPSPLERRSFLVGALAGVCTGASAGFASAYRAPRPRPAPGACSCTDAQPSFAQQGEDLIIKNIFEFLKIKGPTYIDIGAFKPIVSNNTYLFYQEGCRGVLVEPNPALVPKLRQVRPRDRVLEVGIGPTVEDQEVDYYLIAGDGQLNTFSREERDALRAARGDAAMVGTIKRKLVNINKVLAENFPDRAPDLLSTDTEGYDLTILQSLDFERFRPRVLCVETLLGYEPQAPIMDLMQSKDYEARGGTFVNSIFIDRRVLRALEKPSATAPSAAPTDAAADVSAGHPAP